MEMPSILKSEALGPFLQGTALGAAATIVVGFAWGGWVLGGTAAKQSAAESKSAVVAVLAPICANKFNEADNATLNMANLKKESSYQQASFIEKGGWAVLPGSDKAGDGVAKACSVLLTVIK